MNRWWVIKTLVTSFMIIVLETDFISCWSKLLSKKHISYTLNKFDASQI